VIRIKRAQKASACVELAERGREISCRLHLLDDVAALLALASASRVRSEIPHE